MKPALQIWGCRLIVEGCTRKWDVFMILWLL